MFNAKITAITKEILVETNESFLSVAFDIFNDGKKVDERRLGFALDVSQEEIEAEVKKAVETYADDQAHAEANQKVEEANRQADETIENLVGKEIN